MKKKTTSKKKEVTHAKVHIYASFNNTLITISDQSGNVVSSSSAGMHGFKGSRKSTPYAAQITGDDIVKKAGELGIKVIDIHVKGPGGGRENALRTVAESGFKVNYIKDVTSIPHNGCRPSKRRRI